MAVGRACLFPPLSSGGALVARPWLRFHTPLIERSRRIPPHCALGQDLTPSPTTGRGRAGSDVRARSTRRGSLRIRTGNFLRPCRELNRTIREIFPLIRESAFVRFFGICFADKCDRPDRPRLCREDEEGTAGSKPPKPNSRSKPVFCPGERRARHSREFGRQVRRRERTAFRASRWRRRSCRSPPDVPSSTEAAGPNPLWTCS